MKQNKRTNKPSKQQKQSRRKASGSEEGRPQYEAIYVGLDVHSDHIRVVRQIDEANYEPAQRVSWEKIEGFFQKQKQLGKKVYTVYEAGAFGYGLARRLLAMEVECYVIAPCKLDPDHKRVQNDKTDARDLCEKLWRYVHGNDKAMRVVHIPTEEEENKRIKGRHRSHLAKKKQSVIAHGRGLLLSAGHRKPGAWWKDKKWKELSWQLSPELRKALEDCRVIIQNYEQLLPPVEKKLEASAPAQMPLGMGKLSLVLLLREIYDWHRFENRRQVGGFLGLCGGVSSSSRVHYDLGITKCGSPQLRALLVEMAWRISRLQPNYQAVKKWAHILGDKRKHRRLRKRAIVALARQLAVDIWKWQTGRATAEQLGWKMISA